MFNKPCRDASGCKYRGCKFQHPWDNEFQSHQRVQYDTRPGKPHSRSRSRGRHPAQAHDRDRRAPTLSRSRSPVHEDRLVFNRMRSPSRARYRAAFHDKQAPVSDRQPVEGSHRRSRTPGSALRDSAPAGASGGGAGGGAPASLLAKRCAVPAGRASDSGPSPPLREALRLRWPMTWIMPISAGPVSADFAVSQLPIAPSLRLTPQPSASRAGDSAGPPASVRRPPASPAARAGVGRRPPKIGAAANLSAGDHRSRRPWAGKDREGGTPRREAQLAHAAYLSLRRLIPYSLSIASADELYRGR
jgi:hypothetical protein